jgi:SAM-dependent methyltransferase
MDIIGAQTLEVMSGAAWYNRWLLELSESYLGKCVLEIGSGIGNFTDLLSEKHQVTATDINKDYLKELKLHHKTIKSGFGNLETGEFYFRQKKFDSIIAFNVLEHIKNDSNAIRNAHNLLKNDGKLIVIVPAHQMLFSRFDENLGHFRRYTVKSFSVKVEDAGFKVINVRYVNWVSALGWLLFIKLLKRSNMPNKEVSIFGKIGPILLLPEKYIKFPFGLSVFCVAQKK